MLKEQIKQLKEQGLKQSEIAKKLNCSTGLVSYHCNPNVKNKIIKNKRLKRKLLKTNQILINKELDINIINVDWKYAEIICNAKLIELGYETFLPTIGGGEIDLIAHKNDKIYRVQIKSISPTNKEQINLHLCRNSINYKERTTSEYKFIDFFLIYDGNYIYKINKEDVFQSINLRYRLPKNNQIEKIRMAKDFIFNE